MNETADARPEEAAVNETADARPEEAAGQAVGAASQLFDLRSVIALVFGVYGLVLVIRGGFFTTADEMAMAGGIDINLWSGVVMLVVAALFVLWVRLRPLVPASRERGK